MPGQTINDRFLAARYSLTGQRLAKSVCKATTEEMIAPKEKHLDYLLHCTNEPNVSIPQLAKLLVERTQNANWVVVYKSLLTVHHLLAYGNEKFMKHLAKPNFKFDLNNFMDNRSVQGSDMSPFIQLYAAYLEKKISSYHKVSYDFCEIKRSKEERSLRTVNADKLLETLPVLHEQLDGLLEVDCQANDLSNGVIEMCFMLLLRDLIRLFACYTDGIHNLLGKYFDMDKKQCEDALDLYKRFLVQMNRVGKFFEVAENVGIDKEVIPVLIKPPSSILNVLENHLATLEGRKTSAANTLTQSSSSTFGPTARGDQYANGIDKSIKQQALAEEEDATNQYKQSKSTSPTKGASAAANNSFSSLPTTSENIVGLFSPTAVSAQPPQASEDPTPAALPLVAHALQRNPFLSRYDFSPTEPFDTTLANPVPTEPIAPADVNAVLIKLVQENQQLIQTNQQLIQTNQAAMDRMTNKMEELINQMKELVNRMDQQMVHNVPLFGNNSSYDDEEDQSIGITYGRLKKRYK